MAEVGDLQAPLELALLAGSPFLVDEHADPVLEAEVGELGRGQLSLEGLGHGDQVHGGHLVDGGVHEHGVSFPGITGGRPPSVRP
jgi:hypothetical protein